MALVIAMVMVLGTMSMTVFADPGDAITATTGTITIENAAEAERTFSMLMGDDVPPRREFIEQNAHYANIDA